jgi:hypothetical protein
VPPEAAPDRGADGVEVNGTICYKLRALAEEYRLTDRLGFGDVE